MVPVSEFNKENHKEKTAVISETQNPIFENRVPTEYVAATDAESTQQLMLIDGYNQEKRQKALKKHLDRTPEFTAFAYLTSAGLMLFFIFVQFVANSLYNCGAQSEDVPEELYPIMQLSGPIAEIANTSLGIMYSQITHLALLRLCYWIIDRIIEPENKSRSTIRFSFFTTYLGIFSALLYAEIKGFAAINNPDVQWCKDIDNAVTINHVDAKIFTTNQLSLYDPVIHLGFIYLLLPGVSNSLRTLKEQILLPIGLILHEKVFHMEWVVTGIQNILTRRAVESRLKNTNRAIVATLNAYHCPESMNNITENDQLIYNALFDSDSNALKQDIKNLAEEVIVFCEKHRRNIATIDDFNSAWDAINQLQLAFPKLNNATKTSKALTSAAYAFIIIGYCLVALNLFMSVLSSSTLKEAILWAGLFFLAFGPIVPYAVDGTIAGIEMLFNLSSFFSPASALNKTPVLTEHLPWLSVSSIKNATLGAGIIATPFGFGPLVAIYFSHIGKHIPADIWNGWLQIIVAAIVIPTCGLAVGFNNSGGIGEQNTGIANFFQEIPTWKLTNAAKMPADSNTDTATDPDLFTEQDLEGFSPTSSIDESRLLEQKKLLERTGSQHAKLARDIKTISAFFDGAYLVHSRDLAHCLNQTEPNINNIKLPPSAAHKSLSADERKEIIESMPLWGAVTSISKRF